MSTPMVLGAAAPSEHAVASRMAEAKACVDVGPFEALSTSALAAQVHALAGDQVTRSALASVCGGLIDGDGPRRVIDALLRQRKAERVGSKEIA